MLLKDMEASICHRSMSGNNVRYCVGKACIACKYMKSGDDEFGSCMDFEHPGLVPFA